HRARYYSPDLARWINEDPIEFNSGDMNLYRYVENNPLKWIDFFGLHSLHFNGKTINVLDDNDQLADTFLAISGIPPFNKNRLEDGIYKITNLRKRKKIGMVCEGETFGYSVNLEPQFDATKTYLRIHPDGNVPGTAGCVGVKCKDSKRFETKIKNLLNKHKEPDKLFLTVKYPQNKPKKSNK
ncbi:MAG: RHS repeat-associated core domain-containing protein, partial [Oligoflexia bacterium]|nr:RHS repeat-associated core domain-containing protein [Oligoflexia bacterium]